MRPGLNRGENQGLFDVLGVRCTLSALLSPRTRVVPA